MEMLICQIAKKKRYFFIEYGDAYMPNSEKKNAIFLIEYGDAYMPNSQK